jgi:CheY-like chemotaxis protein
MLVLIMIEDTLADLGCKSVTSAATVDKALALINALVFDVAMLDMNLNGSDSQAVADALCARSSISPFERQRRSKLERGLLRSARAKKRHSTMTSWPRYVAALGSHASSDNIIYGAGGVGQRCLRREIDQASSIFSFDP